MGLVQCMTCRQELPCPCQGEITRGRVPGEIVDASTRQPRRSKAITRANETISYHNRVREHLGFPLVDSSGAVKPGQLDTAAQAKLWQAMMREQREDGD